MFGRALALLDSQFQFVGVNGAFVNVEERHVIVVDLVQQG
jgi:hypothetical protein